MSEQNEEYLKLARDAVWSAFNRRPGKTGADERFEAEVPRDMQAQYRSAAVAEILELHDRNVEYRRSRPSPAWNGGSKLPAKEF